MKVKSIRIAHVLLFLLISCPLLAQPNWSVNANDYEYNMTFLASISLNGNYLDSTQDKVAAFINGEVRGVTNLVYEQSNDRYYAYLTVFSNQSAQTISFKVYDSDTDTIIDIPDTVDFEINAHLGNLLQSYSIANPSLNNEAEILSFSLTDEFVNNVNIGEENIELTLNSNIDIQNLNFSFELSEGAVFLFQNTIVESENNSFDLSSPLNLSLRSEDESVLLDYTISVELVDTNTNVVYYKKDAVCYRGGEIKVQFGSEGETFELIRENTIVATKNIVSGEAVFTNLAPDTYVVRAFGIEKNIEISLKE
jgi:hypothetical protein